MNLTPQTLKLLMNEYNLSANTLTDDDEYIILLSNIDKLPAPDKIILYLYAELQSFRKLAKVLGVSFTSAYKVIHQIREKILGTKLDN